jgi:hypothetical protein
MIRLNVILEQEKVERICGSGCSENTKELSALRWPHASQPTVLTVALQYELPAYFSSWHDKYH